jgi:hypothetical protein
MLTGALSFHPSNMSVKAPQGKSHRHHEGPQQDQSHQQAMLLHLAMARLTPFPTTAAPAGAAKHSCTGSECSCLAKTVLQMVKRTNAVAKKRARVRQQWQHWLHKGCTCNTITIMQ